MKSLIISTNRGFTLIEIVVVMALISLVAGLSLFFSMDSFRGYSFHSERDTLISALQHARAEAMANICRGGACTDGKPHGVAIRPADHPNSYVIFQTEKATPTYAGRTADDKDFDALLDASDGITFGGSPAEITEVVFSQLSGDVAVPGEITLTDESIHSSVITINGEGQIIWTN